MTKYRSEDIENKTTQLRKGILELAILSALYRQIHYGYSLVKRLAASGAIDLKEGTIYPILSRLAKEGLVQSEWRESDQGPPRKYYDLTEVGRMTYEALDQEFRRLVLLVEQSGLEAAGGTVQKRTKKIMIRRKDNE